MWNMIYYLLSWSNYFPDEKYSKTLIKRHLTKDFNQQTLTNENWYILDCFFFEITSSSSGGAICVESSNKLLIESSMFVNCSTLSNFGGALYSMLNGDGECVVSKSCSFGCACYFDKKESSFGQFCLMQVRENSYKNCIDDSSFAKSVPTVGIPSSLLYLNYGFVTLNHDNVSYNKNNAFSAFDCENTKLCFVTYSSLTTNNATGAECMGFGGSKEYQISKCNIIGNRAETGIISCKGKLKCFNSTFLFNIGNNLFFKYSGSINLYNCTFDSPVKGVASVKATVSSSIVNEIVFDICGTRGPRSDYIRRTCPNNLYYRNSLSHLFGNVINFLN